jgi:hypothetical protein
MSLVQVDRDRGGTGLVTVSVQVLADLDDLFLDLSGGAPGAAAGPTGARLEAGLALGQVALDVITHRRDTPNSRATSLLDRPSTRTAVTISCGMPIAHPSAQGVNDVPRQL